LGQVTVIVNTLPEFRPARQNPMQAQGLETMTG
jgi:hypothetical protein